MITEYISTESITIDESRPWKTMANLEDTIITIDMRKAIFTIFSVLTSLLLGACSNNKQEVRPYTDSVQLIRNANLKIKYAGKTILVDPLFF